MIKKRPFESKPMYRGEERVDKVLFVNVSFELYKIILLMGLSHKIPILLNWSKNIWITTLPHPSHANDRIINLFTTTSIWWATEQLALASGPDTTLAIIGLPD